MRKQPSKAEQRKGLTSILATELKQAMEHLGVVTKTLEDPESTLRGVARLRGDLRAILAELDTLEWLVGTASQG